LSLLLILTKIRTLSVQSSRHWIFGIDDNTNVASIPLLVFSIFFDISLKWTLFKHTKHRFSRNFNNCVLKSRRYGLSLPFRRQHHVPGQDSLILTSSLDRLINSTPGSPQSRPSYGSTARLLEMSLRNFITFTWISTASFKAWSSHNCRSLNPVRSRTITRSWNSSRGYTITRINGRKQRISYIDLNKLPTPCLPTLLNSNAPFTKLVAGPGRTSIKSSASGTGLTTPFAVDYKTSLISRILILSICGPFSSSCRK
jgi:hypothetical protein